MLFAFQLYADFLESVFTDCITERPALLSPPPPRTFLRPPQFSRGQKSEKCIERAESLILTETLRYRTVNIKV